MVLTALMQEIGLEVMWVAAVVWDLEARWVAAVMRDLEVMMEGLFLIG